MRSRPVAKGQDRKVTSRISSEISSRGEPKRNSSSYVRHARISALNDTCVTGSPFPTVVSKWWLHVFSEGRNSTPESLSGQSSKTFSRYCSADRAGRPESDVSVAHRYSFFETHDTTVHRTLLDVDHRVYESWALSLPNTLTREAIHCFNSQIKTLGIFLPS